ncbi:MAG: DUF2760 domain-containing protein [Nitrosomonas sp.]|nr:MAG: DUF2760 domain-containing protein [Nitrosomonas sp.]
MSLLVAFKVFFRALKNPEETKEFLIPKEPDSKKIENVDLGHLRLLSLLQRSGRLIDFLKEDISSFSDTQVGAAARQVHKECSSLLEDVVTIRPVYQEEEGSKIRIPSGYDASSIKVIGNVKGNPPFEGILMHRGWKAHKRSLPKGITEQASDVICPAEVMVK